VKPVNENEGEITWKKRAGSFSGKTLCLHCKRWKQAGMVRFSLFILTPCLTSMRQPCRSDPLSHSKERERRLSRTGWNWQILLYLQNSSNGQDKSESLLPWAYTTKEIPP